MTSPFKVSGASLAELDPTNIREFSEALPFDEADLPGFKYSGFSGSIGSTGFEFSEVVRSEKDKRYCFQAFLQEV